MTSEEKRLQAELEAMHRRTAYCLYLLREHGSEIALGQLEEWASALAELNSNVFPVYPVDYELGDIPAFLH